MKVEKCIDVIMPVYNGEGTVSNAINSLLTQKGNLINSIIIIDDGSFDNTALIIKSFINPLIKYFHSPNMGVAHARNLGISKSSSDWIAFIDADDIWTPNKLELQLDFALEHDVGFVCCSVNECIYFNNFEINIRKLSRGNIIATSSVLVKRSVLMKIIPVFTEGMPFAEDYLAWLKCLTLTRGYYISIKLVNYFLSERPRYTLLIIIKNIISLNFQYAIFLRKSRMHILKRAYLTYLIICGSIISFLSITKRFFIAYIKYK